MNTILVTYSFQTVSIINYTRTVMYGVILKNLKVQQNTDFLEIREILQL